MVTYTIGDVKTILGETINSNKYNIKQGVSNKNLAVRFIGESGIGKTESVVDFCIENKYAFKYLNLSEITEESSLYGFPRETYKMFKTERITREDGTVVSKKTLKNVRVKDADMHLKEGWEYESKDSELTYSIPQWVKDLEKTEISVLILDEFSRAQTYISQAVMNLVLFGKFGTWSLPAGTNIVLLDNPDDGEYNVSSLDAAQMSRFLNYYVEANIDSWVKWASSKGIHEECINFMYKTPEAWYKSDKDSFVEEVPNFRMWTMFFNRISHIRDLNNMNYFPEIKRAGIGSVGEKMLNLFKVFVDNRLGELPSLREVFDSKTSVSDAVKMMKKAIIQEDGVIRNDIKGLLSLRMIGYCMNSSNINKDFLSKLDEMLRTGVITKEIIYRLTSDLEKTTPNIHRKIIESCPTVLKLLQE